MILELDIAEDGTLTTMYNDIFEDIDTKSINRASNVEFNNNLQRWTVEIIHNLFPLCCLMKTFTKRSEALNAEVEFLNSLIRSM